MAKRFGVGHDLLRPFPSRRFLVLGLGLDVGQYAGGLLQHHLPVLFGLLPGALRRLLGLARYLGHQLLGLFLLVGHDSPSVAPGLTEFAPSLLVEFFGLGFGSFDDVDRRRTSRFEDSSRFLTQQLNGPVFVEHHVVVTVVVALIVVPTPIATRGAVILSRL